MRVIPSVFVAFILSTVAVCASGAEIVPLAPTEGVLVLRRGDVFKGTVSLRGDQYFVILPDREVRLKSSDVEMFCKTLDDAYELKRSRIPPTDVEARLDLAQWCIGQRLFGSAAREIVEVRRLHPDHPRTQLIERRLEVARNRRPAEVDESNTVAVAAQNIELDAMVRGMPEGAVQAFSQSIQPLLLNTCSASNCHHVNADSTLRLSRISPVSGKDRRETQRNLQSVLQVVRKRKPGEPSPLLLQATRAHGGGKSAPLGQKDRDRAALRGLAAWIDHVSDYAKATEEGNTPRLLATDSEAREITPLNKFGTPRETGGVRRATFETESESSASRKSAVRNASATGEPLDPSDFNRRHHESESSLEDSQ